MERGYENVAWLLDTVQNGFSDVLFWASFKTNFIKTCTSEAKPCRGQEA